MERNLDLSPFEIGLALEAPLLHSIDPSTGAAGVLEELGDVRVQYDAGRLVESSVAAHQETEGELEKIEASSDLKLTSITHERIAE